MKYTLGIWFESTILVPAYAHCSYQSLVKHPRYFFFDVGVLNALLENFRASDDRIGALFERLVFGQIYFSAKARSKFCKIFHFRDRHQAEIDFIVELGDQTWAIEVKANVNPGAEAAKMLRNMDQPTWQKVVCHVGATE